MTRQVEKLRRPESDHLMESPIERPSWGCGINLSNLDEDLRPLASQRGVHGKNDKQIKDKQHDKSSSKKVNQISTEFHNIRGLSSEEKKYYARNHFTEEKIDIYGLVETNLKDSEDLNIYSYFKDRARVICNSGS